MNKRDFIKTTVALGSGVLVGAPLVSSCANPGADSGNDFLASMIPLGEGGFLQKELPYGFDALEPYIDTQTMELHYGKHHAGYTKKFNDALSAEGMDPTDIFSIFSRVSEYDPGIRNNGGGYFNHALFWNFLSPDGGGEPTGDLSDAIIQTFGSFEQFKELFSSAALSQFGSGWAWLILSEDAGLKVISTPNQDNPLMDISESKGSPILNLDVWEHAYYLKYQNKRADYIANFWNLVNWETVDKLYKEAI